MFTEIKKKVARELKGKSIWVNISPTFSSTTHKGYKWQLEKSFCWHFTGEAETLEAVTEQLLEAVEKANDIHDKEQKNKQVLAKSIVKKHIVKTEHLNALYEKYPEPLEVLESGNFYGSNGLYVETKIYPEGVLRYVRMKALNGYEYDQWYPLGYYDFDKKDYVADSLLKRHLGK